MKKMWLVMLFCTAVPLCAMDDGSSSNVESPAASPSISPSSTVYESGGTSDSNASGEGDTKPQRMAAFCRGAGEIRRHFGEGNDHEQQAELWSVFLFSGGRREMEQCLIRVGIPVGLAAFVWGAQRHIKDQRALGKPNIFQRLWRKLRRLVRRSEKQEASKEKVA